MESFRNGSIRLFRVFGIDVFLHWSWFLIAFFEIQMRSGYVSRVWNLIEYLSLFGIVLLHEFGHALACRSVGGTARQIVLWPMGGIAFVRPPARPGALLWSIAAGPLVNLVLVPITVGLWLWVDPRAGGVTPGSGNLEHYLFSLTLINALLLFLNLVPIYPLDGGQILWALLWFAFGRWRSLQIVAFLGMLCGGLMLMAAVPVALLMRAAAPEGGSSGAWMPMEIVLAIMAMFVVSTSAAAFFQARHALHIQSLPRHPEAACPSCGSNPPAGPYWVCEHCETRFDTFVSRGACPACGAWYHDTTCPDCNQTHHIGRWFPPVPGEPVPPEQAALANSDPAGEVSADSA
jgi:Zn-dependent protease